MHETTGAVSFTSVKSAKTMFSSKNNGADPNTFNANNFRPLPGFGGLGLEHPVAACL